MPHLLTIAPCGGVLKGDTTGCMELLNMDFSLIDYLDEDACYTKLVELLHRRWGMRRRHVLLGEARVLSRLALAPVRAHVMRAGVDDYFLFP